MSEETNRPSARPKQAASLRLGVWSRAGAIILGVAGLGSGAVAVYVTRLEAGPVGLLAVGFLLLLIGMSGRLPTRLKVGDNEAEWQEEREAFQEFVETVAEDADNKPADLMGALDKLAEAAPEVANPALSAMAYEALVMNAIAELGHGSTGQLNSPEFTLVDLGRRGPVDAIIESRDGSRIAVEIKAYRSGMPLRVIHGVFDSLLRLRETRNDIETLLLISRTELKSTTLDMLSNQPEGEVLVVVLKDPKDVESLKSAIRDALDSARRRARKGRKDL